MVRPFLKNFFFTILTCTWPSSWTLFASQIQRNYFGILWTPPPVHQPLWICEWKGAFCWLVPWIQTIKRQAGNPICPPRCWTHHLSFLLSHARQKACTVHMLHLDGCSRLRTPRRSQQVNVGKSVCVEFPYFTSHICIPCVYVYPACFSSVSDHFR